MDDLVTVKLRTVHRVHTGKRQPNRLSALAVKAIIRGGKSGRWSDGANLSLVSHSGATFSWEFTWRQAGKARSLGLGPYPLVSLAEAREKALECRKALQGGTDPASLKKPVRGAATALTLAEVIAEYVKLQEARWRPGTRRIWLPKRLASLELLATPIEAVTRDMIVAWLETRTTPSAMLAHQCLKQVFSWAIVRSYRAEPNPALFERKYFLSHARHVVTPVKALDWRRMPMLVRALESDGDLPSLCALLQIYCALRPTEARGARWEEFDLDAALWHIPARQMKGKRPHTVPLSTAAVALLRQLESVRHSDFVFPAMFTKGNSITGFLGLATVNRKLKPWGCTGHGARSSFRDWAGDATAFPQELAVACLAHKVGNATEQAYRRSDALEKRREVMEAWASFLAK